MSCCERVFWMPDEPYCLIRNIWEIKSWICYWNRLKPRLEFKHYVIEKQPKKPSTFLPYNQVELNKYTMRCVAKYLHRFEAGTGMGLQGRVEVWWLEVAAVCSAVSTRWFSCFSWVHTAMRNLVSTPLRWRLCLCGSIHAVLHLQEPICMHSGDSCETARKRTLQNRAHGCHSCWW